MTYQDFPEDIPAGCYDPEHWRAANGIEASPSEEEQQNQKAPPKPYLTEAVLENFLTVNGITVRLNIVSHEVEAGGIPAEYNPESTRNDLPVILYDNLKMDYRCDKQTVGDLLNLIAGRNRYNPVLELIDCGEWDGTDYFGQLVEILGIRQDDNLSQTLLYKWACQCYQLLHNQIGFAVGADGMLVLQGAQGIGKTSFVRQIGIRPDFVKLGQWLDPKDKDTLRRCTSAWIVELGEIETTLRSDLERLKAFVTNEVDEYRLPYARADNKTARRTSLVGTCNSERFLIDPTGSRRFWTIPVDNMDLNRLMRFPALKFWRQIKQMCAGHPEDFRLTLEERRALEKRNTAHEKPMKAQLEIEDIIAEAEADPDSYEWRMTTVSEFQLEYASLRRYDVRQIGAVLDKLGYSMQKKRKPGSDNKIKMRELPCHKWGK